MSEQDRVELMARAVQETARTVARQGGELQAMFVVLHGLLAFEGVPDSTREKLHLVLERCSASNLNHPVSEDFISGFLARAELLRGTLTRSDDNFDTHLLV